MDPNAALAEIRETAAIVRDRIDRGEDPDVDGSVSVLVEHVEALDEWLSKGGFLPQDWLRGIGRAGR